MLYIFLFITIMTLHVGCSQKNTVTTIEEEKSKEAYVKSTIDATQDYEINSILTPVGKNNKEISTSTPTKEKEISLFIKEGALLMNYKNASIVIEKDIYQDFHKKPQYQILHKNDYMQYIVIYYSYVFCGGAGRDIRIHVIQYNERIEELSILFDSSNINLNHHFDKDKKMMYLQVKGTDEVSVDITNIMERLPTFKLKDFLEKDKIEIVSTSSIGIQDYDFDGIKELFIRCEIEDINYGIEVTSLYMVLEVIDGHLDIVKIFPEELNNEILGEISNNSFYDCEDSNKEIQLVMQELLSKGIITKNNNKLYLDIDKINNTN